MRERLDKRTVVVATLVAALSVGAAACGPPAERASQHRDGARDSLHSSDPETARSLLHIARAFNEDYQRNRDAAVYGRWDAASRAIISQATFVRRHNECPNSPHVKVDTWGVDRGPGGSWLVHYSIDGQQSTDVWYYRHGRFVFDLPKSNPSAVRLYEASPSQYLKDVGCRP